MSQESSAASFAYQVMKGAIPVSPKYGIRGSENKTSFPVCMSLTYFEFIRILNL